MLIRLGSATELEYIPNLYCFSAHCDLPTLEPSLSFSNATKHEPKTAAVLRFLLPFPVLDILGILTLGIGIVNTFDDLSFEPFL